MSDTWNDGDTAIGGIAELLERARRALVEHVDPSVAEALVLLEDAPEPRRMTSRAAGPESKGNIVARLCIDPTTKDVFVRLCDVRSGMTIREVSPTDVAEMITRLPPTIASEPD